MTATMTAPPIEQVAPKVVTKVKDGDLKGLSFALLGIGLLLLAGTWVVNLFAADHGRSFYFSYLVAYMGVLGICLGALFFVMIQHITRSGWSVVLRRIAENIAGALPWMLLAFLPIIVGASELYSHWWSHVDPNDHVLIGKQGWLNPTFFFVRVAIYFAVWISLAWFFRSKSLQQDQTGDPAISLQLARLAAPGLLLFALSVTFAAFDWIMSLNPHWFSTIFGVTYFAGGYMAFFAFTILLARFLGSKGYLKDAVSTEHYHDLGKLMFTFVVFWTYVNFSQYMLIWYANLPEETQFYSDRAHGGWGAVGTVLIFGHFFIPFAFLMSRHVKRNSIGLATGAAFLLLIHWIDMQYLILPNLAHGHAGAHGEAAPAAAAAAHGFGAQLGEWLHHRAWHEVTCFLGMLALVAGVTLVNVRRAPLLPTRDPRLAESLHFQNL